MTGIAAIAGDVNAGPAPAGDTDGRIAVTRLTLTDFRNYAAARLALDGRSVVLAGANGAGKTNILEAVSFLAPGRGLRRAKLAEVTRTEAGTDGPPAGRTWAVAAEIVGPDGPVSLGTGLDPEPGSVRDRRVVRVDGQPEKAQTVLAEHIAVVWLMPQMDGLFVDGPGARRRFLDRLVYAADPAHAGRVSAYEQAMRERARLLADYGPGADASWLDALEAAMAEKGMAVAAARRDMVGRLAAFIEAGAGPFPGAELSLVGGPEAWLDGMPSLDAEEHLRAGLAADRRTDAGDGRTRTGPHRTDLEVRHGTRKREAALCSTGEQKALLIALVLAHARMQTVERGASPVLLLDEVAAHLDRDRRAALFDLIEGLNTQAWMTGTDAALFDGMRDRAQFFHVAEGVLSAPAT
ncbi:MAG: DNA replication/repair protein RecF [Rhodospirillales bacterium]